MPNLPWPTHRDEPVTGDPSLAALLKWAEFPASSAPEMQPVAEVLAALTAGPADDELAGEAAALAAYRNQAGVPRPATRARRRRRRPLFPFLSARPAATVAAAAAVLGLQRIRHRRLHPGAARAGPAARPRHHRRAGRRRRAGHGPVPGRLRHGRPGRDRPGWRNRPGRGNANRPGAPVPHAARHRPAGRAATPQGSGEPSTEPTPQDSGTPTPTHSKGKPSTHPTPHGNGNGNGTGTGTGTATARRPRSHDTALTRTRRVPPGNGGGGPDADVKRCRVPRRFIGR